MNPPRILILPSPDTWRSPLRRGMRGEDVAAWQRVLGRSGYSLAPGLDDGDFGALTEKRTIQFQLDRGLTGDGVVGAQTRANIGMPERNRTAEEAWPFIQAAGWTWANRSAIRLVVIHTMETGETEDTAEAVAAWFAGHRGPPPKASAHCCVDGDSLVRCVRPEHVAWAAPGANADGYHVELAGRARQTAEEWADPFSESMLRIAAAHVATICTAYAIPVRRLSHGEVADKTTQGFCGHIDVTRAFRKSTHTDPGPNFPWDTFIELVNAKVIAGTT
jgi:hypothetical protein